MSTYNEIHSLFNMLKLCALYAYSWSLLQLSYVYYVLLGRKFPDDFSVAKN